VPPPIFEQMSPLFQATSEQAWFDAIMKLANAWGFNQCHIAMLPRPGMKLEDAYVLSTYAPQWRRAYEENGFAEIDPTVAHCATRAIPLIWCPDIFITDPQRAMYEAAHAYGLRSGVTLPIHGPHHETGMLCVVSDQPPSDAFWHHVDAALPNLGLLRDLVIETGQRYMDEHAKARLPKLTPRERECLQWTAHGKSTWEISHILNCSEAVVNFHMKNIRAKFNVNSRRAAAVVATQLRLIDPD